MKITLIVICFTSLVLTSCKKDIIVPVSDFNNLFGTWNWVQSSGGFGGQVINSNTENYSMSVEYNENGVYKKFKDGKKISKKTFFFEESESIFSSN